MILERFYYGPSGTLGRLFGNEGQPQLWTVERPWQGNAAFVSCIPEGRYSLAPFTGTHWKDVIEVKNVPGRYAILLHPANKPVELAGCIAPGLAGGILNNEPEVRQSKDAFAVVKRWFEAGDTALEIRVLRALLPPVPLVRNTP